MTTLWKGGMLRTCLAAIFIAISQLLPAQTYFRNFSVSDGLSNNTVKSIAFDMDGFLWVGTEDGLNRYDGKTFETVLDFPEELLPVYNEYVSALLTDSRGTLWVRAADFFTSRVTRVSSVCSKSVTPKVLHSVPMS